MNANIPPATLDELEVVKVGVKASNMGNNEYIVKWYNK